MTKVTFTLPAEALNDATEAYLLGEFNQWDLSKAIPFTMQNGILCAVAELKSGQAYEYKIYLNNGNWLLDSNAEAMAHQPHFNTHNSVITVPAKVAEVEEVITPAKKTAVKRAKKVPVNPIETPVLAAPAKKTAAKKAAPKKAK